MRVFNICDFGFDVDFACSLPMSPFLRKQNQQKYPESRLLQTDRFAIQLGKLHQNYQPGQSVARADFSIREKKFRLGQGCRAF